MRTKQRLPVRCPSASRDDSQPQTEHGRLGSRANPQAISSPPKFSAVLGHFEIANKLPAQTFVKRICNSSHSKRRLRQSRFGSSPVADVDSLMNVVR